LSLVHVDSSTGVMSQEKPYSDKGGLRSFPKKGNSYLKYLRIIPQKLSEVPRVKKISNEGWMMV